MKRLALALALLLAPSLAWGQCSGVFANNTVCGNATGALATPRATPSVSFPANLVVGTSVVSSGTNTLLLYNNAGILGNETVTSAINAQCSNSTYRAACVSTYGYANPTWWGAVADCTVTDNAAAFNSAIAALPVNGGRLRPDPGCYGIASTVTLGNGTSSAVSTRNGIKFEGISSGTTDSEFGPSYGGFTFNWTGAAGGTMLRVAGPVKGVTLDGIYFRANAVAGTCVDLQHPVESWFSNAQCDQPTTLAYLWEAYTDGTGSAVGSTANTFINFFNSTRPATGASGARIGALSYGNAPHLDVAQNTIIGCRLYADGGTATAAALILGFADVNEFINCTLSHSVGAAIGLKVSPPTGGENFPADIKFRGSAIVNANNPATWTAGCIASANPYGIYFDNFHTGDGEVIPTSTCPGGYFGTTDTGVGFGGYQGVGSIPTVASAATIEVGFYRHQVIAVTGVINVQFLGSTYTPPIGAVKVLLSTSALTYVHSASLVLPGATNFAAEANSYTAFVHVGSNVWQWLWSSMPSGQPAVVTNPAHGGTGVNNGIFTITVGGNLSTAGAASLPAIVQGDLWYGSAAGVISAVAKDTNATRYLSNTGASNNPAWAQVNLANGVTGTLPGANGGTGLSTAAIGDLIYASATTPTWARLAGVAVGSALMSGGVNTAPAWSAAPVFGTSVEAPFFNASTAASGYKIAGNITLYAGATYTSINDPSGGTKFFFGNAGDPTNYLRNTSTRIETIGGAATIAVFGAGGIVFHTSMYANGAANTVVLKQGANGSVGTFVCTSGGTITINNTNVAITDAIIISLNTVGGTISTPPATKAITAATSFQVLCATNDTSTYNYAIIKNAAWLLDPANDNRPMWLNAAA